jgi:hypothetical protein
VSFEGDAISRIRYEDAEGRHEITPGNAEAWAYVTALRRAQLAAYERMMESSAPMTKVPASRPKRSPGKILAVKIVLFDNHPVPRTVRTNTADCPGIAKRLYLP